MILLGFLILFLLTFAIIVVYVGYIIYRDRHLSKLPGPSSIPLIGYIPPTDVFALFNMFENFTQKYGSTFKYYIGGTLRIGTSDPKIFEEVLKSNVYISKSDLYFFARDWMRDGLLFSDGAKWRNRRKLLTPSFHFSIVKDFFEIIKRSADILAKKLGAEMKDGPMDIQKYIAQFSLDVIGETSLGINIQSQNNENVAYIDAVNSSTKIFVARGFSLWQRFDILFKLFASCYDQYKYNIEVMHKLSSSIIRNKRENMENETKLQGNSKEDDAAENDRVFRRRRPLIDALIEQEDLTDADVQEEVDTFMFEGYDTISTSLSFALYELANHQDVQNKLVDEINSHFDDISGMTQESLQNLTYLDKVVKESARLWTAVPFIERTILEDAEIGGLKIPKGTVISLLIFWLHRNPEYFPDPLKFDPERFDPVTGNKHPTYAFVPFSAGPRNCIGQRYALTEVKTVLIRLIKEFEFLPALSGPKLELGTAAVLTSKHDLQVRLRRRN